MPGGDLMRLMAPIQRRVQGMIARAVVALVDDSLKAQGLQITVLADETHEGVERFQNYGITSVPHVGAEAVVVFVGGTRSHGIAIAVEDRRYRLTGLSEGEVALYDDLGQAVHLKRDCIELTSPNPIKIDAPSVLLGGDDGLGVARIGDAVAGGKIVAGSTKVMAA